MTAAPDAPHVGLVVEGPGDAVALPLLLRRHLEAQENFRDVLGKPLVVHGRGKATGAGGIEGFVATAALRPACRAVLVVLDGEGDCVATLGPELHGRAQQESGVPVHIALADRDFEDWLYASIETLGLGDLAFHATSRGQVEMERLLKPRKYVKPTWQPRLTARMDIGRAASRSSSLARMLSRFDELLAQM